MFKSGGRRIVFTEDQTYLNCHQNIFLNIPYYEIFLSINIYTYSSQKLNTL